MEVFIDILSQYVNNVDYFDIVSNGLTTLSADESISKEKLFRLRFLRVFLNQTNVWSDMKKLEDLVLYELLEESIKQSNIPGDKDMLYKDITIWKKSYQ